jgi:hypothetical protein
LAANCCVCVCVFCVCVCACVRARASVSMCVSVYVCNLSIYYPYFYAINLPQTQGKERLSFLVSSYFVSLIVIQLSDVNLLQ